MRLAGILLLVSSTAVAQPKPECAPSGTPRIVPGANQATVCFPGDKGETCFSIAPGRRPQKTRAPAKQKPPRRSPAELRDVGRVPSACVGTRCTPLGKKAAAAVAAMRATLSTLRFPNNNLQSAADAFLVTGDGKALVIAQAGSPQMWSIADDKLVDLVGPSKSHGLSGIEVASGVIVPRWADCAGPCGKSILVDSSGKNLGAWFPGGDAIGLDDQRIAIIPTEQDATFRVLEASTGKELAALPVFEPESVDPSHGAKIDGKTILSVRVAVDPKGNEILWQLRFVSVPPGKPATVTAFQQIPQCP